MWERWPEQMSAALASHNALMRRLIEEAGGYEVRTVGDAFMVAFQEPEVALRWALAVQVALAEAPWQAASGDFPRIRVRIGLYSGQPERITDPSTGRHDYMGPVANRAARVCAAGHGGQILITRAFWLGLSEAARAALPALTEDLGEYVFRGLVGGEHMMQVLPLGARIREFPPLRTRSRRRTNLEPERDTFVGRGADLARVRADLLRGDRLITLLGPGGVGKTRLSLRAAALELESGAWPGGVWFCDLAEVTDDSGLCREIADLFAVQLDPRRSTEQSVTQVGHALGSLGRTLLVLDNCEQVIGPARRAVERWRHAAPELSFLATSREPLRVRGERAVRLSPLTPSEGAALFLARADAIGVDTSSLHEPDVLRLVVHLEGLPLAIELASARSGVLDPASLIKRLSGLHAILRDNSGDRAVRHSTLARAIAWSWDLLSDSEQRFLSMLSVFRGSFSDLDAEAVWDGPFEIPSALDLLQSLVDRSLLVSRGTPDGADGPRFDMLQSIRAFAEERLTDPGPATERHARRFGARCAEVFDQDVAAPDRVTLARLQGDQANLLAVHLRFRGGGAAAREAVLATLALDALFAPMTPVVERMRLLDAVMSLSLSPPEPLLRARLLLAVAQADRDLGHLSAAEAHLREALRQLDAPTAPRLRCELVRRLGDVLIEQDRRAEGRAGLDQALALAEAIPDRAARGWVHTSLGVLALKEGAFAAALDHHERALQDARQSGDGQHEAKALLNLGVVLREQGDLAGARRMASEAAVRLSAMGETRAAALAMNNLGIVAGMQGDLAEAQRCFEAALQAGRANGLATLEASVRNNLAQLALIADQLDLALSHAERALPLHLGADDARNAAVSRGLIAQVCLLREEHAAAAAALVPAITALDQQSSGARALWMFRALLAAARAELGDHEAAASLLSRAHAEAPPTGDPTPPLMLALVGARLDLARDRLARAPDPHARLHRDHALELLRSVDGGAATPPELLVARRLLAQSLTRA